MKVTNYIKRLEKELEEEVILDCIADIHYDLYRAYKLIGDNEKAEYHYQQHSEYIDICNETLEELED